MYLHVVKGVVNVCQEPTLDAVVLGITSKSARNLWCIIYLYIEQSHLLLAYSSSHGAFGQHSECSFRPRQKMRQDFETHHRQQTAGRFCLHTYMQSLRMLVHFVARAPLGRERLDKNTRRLVRACEEADGREQTYLQYDAYSLPGSCAAWEISACCQHTFGFFLPVLN